MLTTCIGLPLIAAICFIPFYHYIAFCILATTVCVLGSYEMRNLVDPKKQKELHFMPWIGSLLPISAYIEYAFLPRTNLTLFVLITILSIQFAYEAFNGSHDAFKGSKERMETCAMELIYPNLFGIFFIRFGFMPNAWMWLLTFFLFVFGSDTFAFLFGMCLGKNNQGYVKVSPKKSLAGFFFGIFMPSLFGLLLTLFIPSYHLTWYQGMILGAATAVAGTCGDLIESAFKRSADVKDSGTMIPGRGGILDSIDSLLIAAPIFQFVLTLFK